MSVVTEPGQTPTGQTAVGDDNADAPVWKRLTSLQSVWILGVLLAIVRAITWANKIVFLDEPTAALGVVQTKNVLDTIKGVRDKGIAVVLISHSMPHVLEVADRVQVMRLGTRVATMPAEGTTVEQLVGAMTGALDLSNSTSTPTGSQEAAK